MNLEEKKQLLKQLLEQQRNGKVKSKSQTHTVDDWASFEKESQVEKFAEVKALGEQFEMLTTIGVENPYFRINDGIVDDKTKIAGRKMASYSSYNYLGLSGDVRVSKAAKDAIDKYGTTVSASRVATGERQLHHDLESAIARFLGTESALAMVSGHATNVAIIGHLMKPGDLIVYDEFSHNCIMEGNALSGARRIPFKHNEMEDCERVLKENRRDYKRVLIVVEGVYSMDGDMVDLPALISLKKKFRTLLMVDEAHSIGTVGKTGRGVREHFDADSEEVDIWMGTFSKSFASCGGYVAGKEVLIKYLRYTTPGFLFSVGISPANAAAALKSIEIIMTEPERVKLLQERSVYFLEQAKIHHLDTGLSCDSPVIPIIIGDSQKALLLAHSLFERGINVQPIVSPAVPEDAARLRFFITSKHKETDILETIKIVREVLDNSIPERI